MKYTLIFGLGLLCGLFIAHLTGNSAISVYQDYNHARFYEDGSYVAQTHDGRIISGCVKGGLCED